MRRAVVTLLMICFLLALTGPVHAEDKRFNIRFGIVSLNPTGSSTINNVENEVKNTYGPAFDFEWRFSPLMGLEGAIATAIDADVEEDGEKYAAVTMTPITAGLNFHVVRTKRLNWAVGVLAGQMIYADFDIDGDTATVTSENDFAYGAQTFLDFRVSPRWGVHIGVEYLKTQLEASDGSDSRATIDVDPVLIKAMGIVSW